MTSSTAEAAGRFSACTDPVSSDFVALASHMSDCERSRGRFFLLRAGLESLHAATASRIVTTGALVIFCGLGLLALA